MEESGGDVDMNERKNKDFDEFIEGLQQDIIEEEKAIYSKKVIDEYNNPKNAGRMKDPDTHGIISGPCGDTMEIYLKISDDRIVGAMFMTDGCGATIACGSMITTMVMGKDINDIMGLTNKDLINALDGLPEENLHCAALAVNTLHKAIDRYEEMENR